RNKIEKVLGGIANLNRLPAAVFIVDISHEHIALAESRKLGLRTFAMVDTNSNPGSVDFPIPANDDASKSIIAVTTYLTGCIKEGLEERNKQKEEKKASQKG
ncbi:MAG: 30S ribosomal protein S2, partial [Saprospiraceae bacterium]